MPGQLLRVGLSTGDVVWRDGRCEGAPVRIAAELLQRAQSGQILVSNVVRWSAVSGANGYVPIGPIEIDADADTDPIERFDGFEVEWEPVGTASERTARG